jgi:hypothetical protein
MSQTLVKSFYATEVQYEWRRLVRTPTIAWS